MKSSQSLSLFKNDKKHHCLVFLASISATVNDSEHFGKTLSALQSTAVESHRLLLGSDERQTVD